jgi:hypothetical protein
MRGDRSASQPDGLIEWPNDESGKPLQPTCFAKDDFSWLVPALKGDFRRLNAGSEWCAHREFNWSWIKIDRPGRYELRDIVP